MRRMAICGAAAAALGTALAVEQPPVTLLTIPQRDAFRPRMDPPSATISADGRYIALSSYARLVPADTDEGADVYVLDQASGAVTLESLADDGRTLDGDNTHPRLSGDGRYLVFETVLSTATSKPGSEIVVRDRLLDTTRRVIRGMSGDAQHGWSGHPAISDDGRTIVFESTATDLVGGPDQNGSESDVYLIDLDTSATHRVSIDGSGVQRANGASFTPSVSADGRYIAFASTADLGLSDQRIVSGTRRSGGTVSHIYVRDRVRNLTTRVSVTSEGRSLEAASLSPVISRDGLQVAFVSQAANLARHDRNRSADVFLSDVRTGSTTLVSRSVSGGAANGASGNPAISADGRFVAFQSVASDLVCSRRCPKSVEDINLVSDVFLFDRTTGLVTWISASDGGGWMEESGGPALDARGDTVAFTSRHPIDDRDVANDFDLFVRLARPRSFHGASFPAR